MASHPLAAQRFESSPHADRTIARSASGWPRLSELAYVPYLDAYDPPQ